MRRRRGRRASAGTQVHLVGCGRRGTPGTAASLAGAESRGTAVKPHLVAGRGRVAADLCRCCMGKCAGRCRVGRVWLDNEASSNVDLLSKASVKENVDT